MYKTFADIKRALAKPGAAVTMIRNDWYPENYLLGAKRKVIKMQYNGVQFEGGSWLMYPKASDIVTNETGFSVVLNGEKSQFMSYVITEGIASC